MNSFSYFCWTWIPAVIWIIHWISIFRQNEWAFNEEYNKEYVEKKKKEKYWGLIECDALKEKWLITKEEYKERVENVKAEIQRLEEEEKEMRIGKEEELKKIEKSKGIIIFFAVVVWLLLLLGILAIFFLKE